MPRLNWTFPARADLRQIDAWLRDLRPPAYAARTLARLRERAAFLENFPHAVRPGRDGVRVLRVRGTSLLLLYQVKDSEVQILRIRHEREDWLVRA